MNDDRLGQTAITQAPETRTRLWVPYAAGVAVWAGAEVALFTIFKAVINGLGGGEANDDLAFGLFLGGILFATQVLPAIGGAWVFAALHKQLRHPGRAAGFFAVAACALGLVGTLLYVFMPINDWALDVTGALSMIVLYAVSLLVDALVASGCSYPIGRALERRRQRA